MERRLNKLFGLGVFLIAVHFALQIVLSPAEATLWSTRISWATATPFLILAFYCSVASLGMSRDNRLHYEFSASQNVFPAAVAVATIPVNGLIFGAIAFGVALWLTLRNFASPNVKKNIILFVLPMLASAVAENRLIDADSIIAALVQAVFFIGIFWFTALGILKGQHKAHDPFTEVHQ